VLSGSGMIVARSAEDVETYLQVHAGTPLLQPLLVDKFLEGAVELNVDAVSDGHETVAVIMEQLDECGVHSGDSAEVYPPQTISPDILRSVQCHTRTIARAFEVVGLVNVQYAVQDGHVYVLEVNPRASRSVPFASKASGIPLADLAVRAILGERLSAQWIDAPRTDRISVKNVVFPFRVFPGLDPILGPEMQSTGESMGVGATFAAAYWKAWLGAGLRDLPFGQSVYISAPPEDADTVACLVSRLQAAGCRVVLSLETIAADATTHRRAPGSPNITTLDRSAPEELDVSALGLAIVLGRSQPEISLLRRAVDARVATISTRGSLRALIRALREGIPDLGLMPTET
jgi:carbamoyl-phosphate synthase large subunit